MLERPPSLLALTFLLDYLSLLTITANCHMQSKLKCTTLSKNPLALTMINLYFAIPRKTGKKLKKHPLALTMINLIYMLLFYNSEKDRKEISKKKPLALTMINLIYMLLFNNSEKDRKEIFKKNLWL